MNTLSDGPRFATGSTRPEDALLRVVAEMDPGWVVLRDCALADGNQGARARVRYALLHPDIGIALLDLLPGSTTPGAPNRLRALLDAVGFRAAFGNYPPVVYLCVPSRSLFGLNGLLVREFDLQPPLALAGGDAWVGAVQGVLTAEPPLRGPGQAVAETEPPFLIPSGAQTAAARADGGRRPAPRPNPAFHGLAAFWGVVALAFGGGALVLQSLGPPEGSTALAQASGADRGEPQPQQPGLAASEAWLVPSDPDKTRLPSPSALFALWPGERMPVRFDSGPAGAGTPEADSLAVFDPRVDDDRPVPAAEATKAVPSSKFPTSAMTGRASIGRDGAGGARVAAAEASPHTMAAGAAALPAGIAGGGPDAAAPALETPGASNAGSDTGVIATEAEASERLPGPPQDRIGPAIPPDAPALVAPDAADNDAVAATPPKPERGEGAGTANDPGVATADPLREAAPPMPVAVQGASRTASDPDGGSSAERSTASDDPPASAATPPALSGAVPLPSDTTSRAGGDGAATRAAGPEDASGPPRLGAAPAEQAGEASKATAAPLAGNAQDAAQADPPGVRTQENPASSDAPPQRAEAEGVAGAVAPAGTSTSGLRGGTSGEEDAAPIATPAVGARPMEPSARPETPVPQTAAAPPGGTGEPAPQTAALPPGGAADPAPSSGGASVARPAAQESRYGAAPAEETERRRPTAASMPPALVEALVARGDAMMARRDISAARLLYERAAVAGSARAASALGRTYDPAFLAEIGAPGVRGDPELATAWYQKAISLGDSGALARMDALNGPDSAARKRP